MRPDLRGDADLDDDKVQLVEFFGSVMARRKEDNWQCSAAQLMTRLEPNSLTMLDCVSTIYFIFDQTDLFKISQILHKCFI